MFNSFATQNAGIVSDGLLMHLDFASNPQIYANPNPTRSSYFDLSGNGNSGLLISGSMQYDANIGNLDFNNTLPSGSQIQPNLGTNWYNQLVTGSWTAQYWANYDVITGDPAIMSQGNGANNNGLHVIARSNKLIFAMFNNDLTSASDLTIGRWQMFTLVYYGISPWRKEIWFDNRLDASHNGNQYLGAPGAGAPNNFTLGYINWPSFKGGPMNGKIGNFLFYKKILSPSEINQNYQATKNRFNIFT
jgi:hypothetical protein